MKLKLSDFLQKAVERPIIDVRAPKEFEQGHIPGAINIPLFTDEERAVVGTAYKRVSPEKALEKGLEFVGPKMATWVKQVRKLTSGRGVLVHCWRGGMRSQSFAHLLNFAGIQADTLDGGYKSYRTEVLEFANSASNLLVLSGATGVGKTEILHQLQTLGEQVLDLEGIAHHRGSVFGHLGMEKQPTSEQFQNNLYSIYRTFDSNKRVWVEFESAVIGGCALPEQFFKKLHQSNIILITIGKEDRIQRILKDYGSASELELMDSLDRITKRMGPQHAKAAKDFYLEGKIEQSIELLLDFYDKYYFKNIELNRPFIRFELIETQNQPEKLAQVLINEANKHGIH